MVDVGVEDTVELVDEPVDRGGIPDDNVDYLAADLAPPRLDVGRHDVVQWMTSRDCSPLAQQGTLGAKSGGQSVHFDTF